MTTPRQPDLTVVLPFAAHEEVVGKAVRRVADHLRALGLSFELLAVDQGASDNSRSVLALLRKDLAELDVCDAEGDLVVAPAVARARGRVLWVLDVEAALAPLAPFARAHREVARGAQDIVVVTGRFAVCYRSRTADALRLARGTGERFTRSLVRRARPRRLAIELVRVNKQGRARTVDDRAPLSRLVHALTAARAAWTGPR